MKKYLLVGNGVAGTTAAENIRKNDPTAWITIVTEEEIPFYYRIRLPDFLCGEVNESGLIAKKKEWYEENNITLRLSTKITGGSVKDKILYSSSGEELSFDRLILANGSTPNIPAISGSDKRGVFSLHYIQDAKDIVSQASCCKKAILIGGGLLGLEAGNGLKKLGLGITVIEFFPRLLPRQLDSESARRLQSILEDRGFSFKLDAKTRSIEGNEKIEGVTLENGEFIAADMVIISAGVTPKLQLAKELGLDCNRGIKVDKQMRTSQPDIYAAGDIVEFEGRTYGIWPAAMEQGKIAGTNISGGNATYEGTILSSILKVAGIDLASAGEIDEENLHDSKTVASETIYKKIVLDNNRVIGCIMLGDRKNFNRINRAISTGEDILSDLDTLLAI
ncbi:MAG: FAD-dependent oxidoreductase [Desulfobacterales bacterium]|nr:FAD-dependent oxidoreductase [Desulfobacterales bacterium]